MMGTHNFYFQGLRLKTFNVHVFWGVQIGFLTSWFTGGTVPTGVLKKWESLNIEPVPMTDPWDD